jgi:Mannosylglycerate hydrolase MGH1-like glycoside hydrolase domain
VNSASGSEVARRDEADAGLARWRRWGPYLSERGWASVREDYSSDGDAWTYFPFDHARSRTYRWNEDGMGGFCDIEQFLCVAFSFWNGEDPFLKERPFGLTNSQGNHGEDVKDYWWYLDSTPTHSWMSWRYHYPKKRFPYEQLVEVNAARTKDEPEYELLDTGVFDGSDFWAITIDYAKPDADSMCMELTARNVGGQEATLHVLPTMWFRNRWSWKTDAAKPGITLENDSLRAEHEKLGTFVLRGDGDPRPLFCENETNTARCFGGPPLTPYPKDGINDHVVSGSPSVNPGNTGTKAALHYQLTVAPGASAKVRLAFAPESHSVDLGRPFTALMSRRRAEADEFYTGLAPSDVTFDEAAIMRQAFAGMLWSKQFYNYSVDRWLKGDPTQPEPPASRESGRNSGWKHFQGMDVLSMPDTWEYPWFASWDLAFHCVAMAHVDAEFAKRQLILLLREWYMHPSGQLPAYEWSFDDANPPVHAWAALRVFEIDGGRDYDFLERVFHKLLINFTWWVNRKDTEGNNVFEGGFLGLDNIGPFNRSTLPPGLGHLEQSDGTAWMAAYCLNLLEVALVLAHHDSTYEDVATKFFEHFAYIAYAMDDQGLWNEEHGFYFDVLHLADGSFKPLEAYSTVGLIAICAVAVLDPETAQRLPNFTRRLEWFLRHKPEYGEVIAHVGTGAENQNRLFSVVSPERLVRILERVLDPGQFLGDGGIRALSKIHEQHPLEMDINGVAARLDYEPGESTSGLFGGNSNWRGPIWFPVNYLLIEALRRYAAFFGDELAVEFPTGSGHHCNLATVADQLSDRLVGLFRRQGDGRRPIFGSSDTLQNDPNWRDLLVFSEYFHGDTGRGLGASHQTGWTGLVADLIACRDKPERQRLSR